MALPQSMKNRIVNRATKIVKGTTGVALNLAIDTVFPKDFGKIAGDVLAKKNPLAFSKLDEKLFNQALPEFKNKLYGYQRLKLLDVLIARGDSRCLLIQVESENSSINSQINGFSPGSDEQNFAILIKMNPGEGRNSKVYTAEALKPLTKWFNLSYSLVYLPNFPSIENKVEVVGPIFYRNSFKKFESIGGPVDSLVQKTATKTECLNKITVSELLNTITSDFNLRLKKIKIKENFLPLQEFISNARDAKLIKSISKNFITSQLDWFKNYLHTTFGTNSAGSLDLQINLKVSERVISFVFDQVNTPIQSQLTGFAINICLEEESVKLYYRNYNSAYKQDSYTTKIPDYNKWADDILNDKNFTEAKQSKEWKDLLYKIVDIIVYGPSNVNASFSELLSRMK